MYYVDVTVHHFQICTALSAPLTQVNTALHSNETDATQLKQKRFRSWVKQCYCNNFLPIKLRNALYVFFPSQLPTSKSSVLSYIHYWLYYRLMHIGVSVWWRQFSGPLDFLLVNTSIVAWICITLKYSWSPACWELPWSKPDVSNCLTLGTSHNTCSFG